MAVIKQSARLPLGIKNRRRMTVRLSRGKITDQRLDLKMNLLRKRRPALDYVEWVNE
jgi:hypothetical protein